MYRSMFDMLNWRVEIKDHLPSSPSNNDTLGVSLEKNRSFVGGLDSHGL